MVVSTGATVAAMVIDDEQQSARSDVMQNDPDETVLYYGDGVTA